MQGSQSKQRPARWLVAIVTPRPETAPQYAVPSLCARYIGVGGAKVLITPRWHTPFELEREDKIQEKSQCLLDGCGGLLVVVFGLWMTLEGQM